MRGAACHTRLLCRRCTDQLERKRYDAVPEGVIGVHEYVKVNLLIKDCVEVLEQWTSFASVSVSYPQLQRASGWVIRSTCKCHMIQLRQAYIWSPQALTLFGKMQSFNALSCQFWCVLEIPGLLCKPHELFGCFADELFVMHLWCFLA